MLNGTIASANKPFRAETFKRGANGESAYFDNRDDACLWLGEQKARGMDSGFLLVLFWTDGSGRGWYDVEKQLFGEVMNCAN